MRIGIDAHVLGKGKGGTERYVQQLVEQVPLLLPEHEFVALVNRHYVHAGPLPPNLRLESVPISDPLIQRSIVLPYITRKLRLDLLHVQRIAPPAVRCPVVLTVHDLLPITHPADHPGLHSTMVRWLTPGSVLKARAVLTVSRTMREEIARYYPSAADRIIGVYNGAEHGFFHPLEASANAPSPTQERLGVNAEYLLYLGAVTERKNLAVLLRGFERFVRSRETKPMLVIGGMCRAPGYLAELLEIARSLGIEELVRFTGFLTEVEYRDLLQGASLFVAPSRGEGFDLPPLEAMACGIPVVASDIPVHRELFEGWCETFSTNNPADLAYTLDRLWDDGPRRARLSALGRARALEFTWEAMTRQIASIYIKVLDERAMQETITEPIAAITNRQRS